MEFELFLIMVAVIIVTRRLGKILDLIEAMASGG
jgi:hypothetical protein